MSHTVNANSTTFDFGERNMQIQFGGLLTDYISALSRIEKWGIKIPAQSRLWRYSDRLREAYENTSSEAPLGFLTQLMFDLREIDEISEIVASFVSTPTDSEFQKLRKIVKGMDHPDKERNANARDTQYELYLRAMFHRAGVPAKTGEHDLVVYTGGREYPLEAKRPKSEKRLDERLRKAVNQLQRHYNPGIVAVSLDHLVRPRDKYLSVRTTDELGIASQDLLDLFRFEHGSSVQARVKGRNLAGVLYTMRVPALVTGRGLLCLESRTHFDGFITDDHPHFEIVRAVSHMLKRME